MAVLIEDKVGGSLTDRARGTRQEQLGPFDGRDLGSVLEAANSSSAHAQGRGGTPSVEGIARGGERSSSTHLGFYTLAISKIIPG